MPANVENQAKVRKLINKKLRIIVENKQHINFNLLHGPKTTALLKLTAKLW